MRIELQQEKQSQLEAYEGGIGVCIGEE